MKTSIQVQATASIANLSCGFDCLGLSIEEPADIITLKKSNTPGITITMAGEGTDSIPLRPNKNTAGKGIQSLLTAIESKQGIHIHIEKGIPPGSGLGSSAASASGAVFAANELLGCPLELNDLLIHCMAGEAVASGEFHADNVAPVLFGGLILIRSYDPLDLIHLPVPEKLIVTAVLPDMAINTKEARSIIPRHVPLKTAVEQSGNLAGFITALHRSDYGLLGRSMIDMFAEPFRKELIPGYDHARKVALDHGAIACGIAGSGPALFAFSDTFDSANKIGKAIADSFQHEGLISRVFCSGISKNPPKILD